MRTSQTTLHDTSTASRESGFINFDQVAPFDRTEGQIARLVEVPFSLTELTFPGPRPSDELYQLFSQAYIAECGKIDDVAVMIGRMFIEALEREQLVKDQGK